MHHSMIRKAGKNTMIFLLYYANNSSISYVFSLHAFTLSTLNVNSHTTPGLGRSHLKSNLKTTKLLFYHFFKIIGANPSNGEVV